MSQLVGFPIHEYLSTGGEFLSPQVSELHRCHLNSGRPSFHRLVHNLGKIDNAPSCIPGQGPSQAIHRAVHRALGSVGQVAHYQSAAISEATWGNHDHAT